MVMLLGLCPVERVEISRNPPVAMLIDFVAMDFSPGSGRKLDKVEVGWDARKFVKVEDQAGY
jgi:hypothetical protein